MSLSQLLLRIVGKKTEEQRMEFRRAMACASAHAEDLTRTVCFMAEDLQCTGKQSAPSKGVKPS